LFIFTFDLAHLVSLSTLHAYTDPAIAVLDERLEGRIEADFDKVRSTDADTFEVLELRRWLFASLFRGSLPVTPSYLAFAIRVFFGHAAVF